MYIEIDEDSAIKKLETAENLYSIIDYLLPHLREEEIRGLLRSYISTDIELSKEEQIKKHLYELKVFGFFTKEDLDRLWELL